MHVGRSSGEAPRVIDLVLLAATAPVPCQCCWVCGYLLVHTHPPPCPPSYVDAVDHPEAGQQSSTATGAFLRAVLCVRNNQVGRGGPREGSRGWACMRAHVCAHGAL